MMEKIHKKNIIGNDSETSVNIRLISFTKLKCNRLAFLNFLIIFLFFSCKTSEKEKNDAKTPNEDFNLNQKKCTDFAYKLHQAIVSDEKNYINNYIIWDYTQKKIEENLGHPLTKNEKEIFNYLIQQVKIEDEFQQLNNDGGHLRFVTYYHLEDEHFIIFRSFMEPQSLNYIELKLETHNQTIAITDFYDFDQSQLVSDAIEEKLNYYISFGNQWNKIAQSNDSIYNLIIAEINDNNYTNAYLHLKDFEQSFKTTSSYASLEESVLIASGIPELIIKSLESKVKRTPLTEKGRWLHLFYYNALLGKYNDANIALVNLENEVGTDDVITFLKGNLEIEKGKYENAIQFFNEALSSEKNIMTFHLAKVIAYIELQDYEKAVESLLVMDDFFEIKDIDWNKEFESYPDFINSDAYSKWKERIEN